MSSFGGGSPGPTNQQEALQRSQATANANLNLQENEQRKVILNAMQGTRVFRGSALSRSIAENTAGTGTPSAPSGAPSATQQAPPVRAGAGGSLLDLTTQSPTGGLAVQGQGATPGGRVGVASGAAGGRGGIGGNR